MRIKFFLAFLLSLSLLSCNKKRESDDQGHTSSCWIYALLTCIEQEQKLKGEDITLSRAWLMTKCLERQTEERYHNKQQMSRSAWHEYGDAQNRVSLRGVGAEALELIEEYGLVPEMHEKTQITQSDVTERRLMMLADRATSLNELREGMQNILPLFTVVPPNGAFYYFSMRYDAHQFAESIMYDQHWQCYASSPNHPWGERFALEVPDNHRHHKYINVPMKELLRLTMRSLSGGHAVYWEMGKRNNDGTISSMHALAIVRIVPPKTPDSEPELLCKNSYSKNWGDHGYCKISLQYFMEHTCNIMIIDK